MQNFNDPLVSVAEQVTLNFTRAQTQKTGFLATKRIKLPSNAVRRMFLLSQKKSLEIKTPLEEGFYHPHFSAFTSTCR